jgi:DNA invertase Pin-like site-specific DNA recombinase
MSPKPQPKAYSYLRFSTPEQMKGDSFRRQTALAQAYAERHGLNLRDDTYHDLGVSGFQLKNAKRGQLGLFLEACRAGQVEAGSYLLVENLDRISRADPYSAVRVLQDICDEGIVVVTLGDQHEYTKEGLRKDPMSIMMSVMTFLRANQESELKSRRLKEAWKHKRRRAARVGNERGVPTTSTCPGWLELDHAAKPPRFKVIPERAEIVKRIYEDVAKGIGKEAIARDLNKRGVPTFGRGAMWRRSYITKLTTERRASAVIGTYSPYESSFDDKGKRVLTPLPQEKNYFPAIIAPKLFAKVQALNDSASPRRGKNAGAPLRNVFGGLARCPKCDGTMTLTSKGSSPRNGKPRLVCMSAKMGKGCTYRTVHYDAAAGCFFDNLKHIIAECPKSAQDPKGRKYEARLAEIEAALDGLASAKENVFAAMEKRGSRATAEHAAELSAEEDALRAEEVKVRDWLVSHANTLVQKRARDLINAVEKKRDTAEINARMRQIFSAVVIDYTDGHLYFRWSHRVPPGTPIERQRDDETAVGMFAWPEAE